MKIRAAFVLIIIPCALAAGCSRAQPALGPCIKVGQTCDLGAGKLGSCVARDDVCDGGDCFACQPQH